MYVMGFVSVDKIMKNPSYQKLYIMRGNLKYSAHDNKCMLNAYKNNLAWLSRLIEVILFDQDIISTAIKISGTTLIISKIYVIKNRYV